mmetsp:Transcript_51298/g.128843  ORF Transcript_51298/g.128843 Transcript_51298/m.128843 type:complete len:204 (-) Transcript_51298:51-662(-)
MFIRCRTFEDGDGPFQVVGCKEVGALGYQHQLVAADKVDFHHGGAVTVVGETPDALDEVDVLLCAGVVLRVDGICPPQVYRLDLVDVGEVCLEEAEDARGVEVLGCLDHTLVVTTEDRQLVRFEGVALVDGLLNARIQVRAFVLDVDLQAAQTVMGRLCIADLPLNAVQFHQQEHQQQSYWDDSEYCAAVHGGRLSSRLVCGE